MAKPAITLRSVKDAALNYSELDTNFENLQNATIGFTVGGSTADIDLNSALTVVAGTNVTLVLDDATNTLTINASGSGGGSGITNPLSANLDTGNFQIFSSNELILRSGDPATFPDLRQLTLISNGSIILRPNATGNNVTLIANKGSTGGPNPNFIFTTTTPSGPEIRIHSDSGIAAAPYGQQSIAIRAPGGVHLPAPFPTYIGDLRIGNIGSNSVEQITTTGTGNLVLDTNNGTNSASIEIENGSNASVVLKPNGVVGYVDIQGKLKISGTTGTPSNTTTPAQWLQVVIGTTTRYIPLYPF
jgi:hypothetical protein